MCEKDDDGKYYLMGMQPDLVGEYFVYTFFATSSDIEINVCLQNIAERHMNELARFLLRFIEDNKKYIIDNNKLDLFEKYIPDQYLTFTLFNEEGKSVVCEVLFTFESDETGKNYIVYTDNTIDCDGHTKVYAAIYDSFIDKTMLYPLETDKEWKIIESILNELQRSVGSEEWDETGIDEIAEQIENKLKYRD